MWWAWRFSVRDAFAAIVLFWLVGGVLLLFAWRSSAAAERVEDAPLCVAGQVFTTTKCRFTLDGTMTGLTSDRADINVDGRHFSVSITLAGKIRDVAGTPVNVTFYRGEPIHVEGPRLRFDSDGAPADRTAFFRNGGLFFLIFGTVAGGINLIIALASRPGPLVRGPGAAD